MMLCAGIEVINTNNFVTEVEQLFAEMGAEEANSAGDEGFFIYLSP